MSALRRLRSALALALILAPFAPLLTAQNGVRPTPGDGTVITLPGGGGAVTNPGGGGAVTVPGVGTLPGNIIGNLPGNIINNPGIIITNPGNNTASRIVADTGVLVGNTAEATAIPPAAIGAAATAPNATSSATYLWSISGGRIIGSTTSATVSYVADTAGTVTLAVSVTSAGVTTTASSTVTAISGVTAGAITAPATAAPAAGPNAATITVSVPAAQNADRTFRWTVSGDAAITAGQGTATATIRAGTPGLKEITCEVTLQRLVTVPVRSFLVVTGDGLPTALAINNGSGGGTYNANSRVDIFANPPPAGQVFDRWTGDTAVFGANAPLAPLVPHNVITVPSTPVTLTATYKAAPVWTPTTLTNFNPQTQPTGTGTQTASVGTTLAYHLPADAIGLVFLLHETGASATGWFNSPEGALLVRDLVAAGYGVAALSSINRTTGAWAAQATLGNNADALNHVAALNKFLADGLPVAMKPTFFLGVAGGADAAVRYADLLATATPARNVRGAVLYCAAGNETLAVTSKVPQFYALAANDDTLGATGLATARANVQLLAGRGLAAATVTNAVSPVHSGRFRALGLTAAGFTPADATTIWTALKSAGLLDANNYLKTAPNAPTFTATITAALPEAYRARAADIVAQLAVAAAAQEFFSDANVRVLNFLNARVAGTPAPAPGRLVNLSTRTKIAYVGDSFSFGFNLGGGTASATLLIRGVGPALGRFGVTTALAAPRLEINDSAGRLIASNERWDAPGGTVTAAQITTAATSVGAFALAAGSLDTAVLLPNLAPGSYTATIRGVNGATGDVLAEVYDVSKNATRLTNLSTLAKIADDGDLLIPGIVVQGANPRTLVVRAIGPGLGDFGLPASAVLTDPRISVLNANGATIDTNNNWTQGGVATLTAVFPAIGAFPLKAANAADAALVTSVSAGSYTLQAGAAPSLLGTLPGVNSTGSVLVEVYEVP